MSDDDFTNDGQYDRQDRNQSDDGFSSDPGAETGADTGAGADHGEDPGATTAEANFSQTQGAFSPEMLSLGGPRADFVDVQAKPTQEYEMDAILRVLAADVRSSRYDQDLVFKFGPLESFAKQINEQVKNTTSIPELTEAVQFYVNKSFHQAVEANVVGLYDTDGTPLNMKTPEGVAARVTTLQDAAERFKVNFKELKVRLVDAGYPADTINYQVLSDIGLQVTRLQKSMESTRPMTLADSLLMSASNAWGKYTANGDHAGDVRDFNNRRINETLMKLRDIGADVRFNAGKHEWERADGKAAAAEGERLYRDLMGLTKGRETHLNSRAINAQVEEIMESFEQGAKNAADGDLKKRMKQIAEGMAALIERITNVVKRAFSRFDAPSPFTR